MDDSRREALRALKEKMKKHAAESANVVQAGEDGAEEFEDFEKRKKPAASRIRKKKGEA